MNLVQIILSLPSAHPWLQPLLTTPTPLATLPSPMQRAHAAILTLSTPSGRVMTALIPAFHREGITCGLAVLRGHVCRFALHDRHLELLIIIPQVIIRIHPSGVQILRHSATGLPQLTDVTEFEKHDGHGHRGGSAPRHPLDYSAFAGNITLLSGEYGHARVSVRVDEAAVTSMCEAAAEVEGRINVNRSDFRSREANTEGGASRGRRKGEADQRNSRKRRKADRLVQGVRKGWNKVSNELC